MLADSDMLCHDAILWRNPWRHQVIVQFWVCRRSFTEFWICIFLVFYLLSFYLQVLILIQDNVKHFLVFLCRSFVKIIINFIGFIIFFLILRIVIVLSFIFCNFSFSLTHPNMSSMKSLNRLSGHWYQKALDLNLMQVFFWWVRYLHDKNHVFYGNRLN